MTLMFENLVFNGFSAGCTIIIEGIEFILVTCIKLPIFLSFAVSKLSFRIFKLSFGIFGKLSFGQNAQK